MAERQAHKGTCLQGYTDVPTPQKDTMYRYHAAAPTPQVHKSMPWLGRYRIAKPKGLLGIFYIVASDGTASSAQERQSRNEYG